MVAVGLLAGLPEVLGDLGRLAAVLVLQLGLVLAWVLVTGIQGFAGSLAVGAAAAVRAGAGVGSTDAAEAALPAGVAAGVAGSSCLPQAASSSRLARPAPCNRPIKTVDRFIGTPWTVGRHDPPAEASAAQMKRRLAAAHACRTFHAVVTVRCRNYWRTVRGLSGVAGVLLRNGLMSSPPRRV
jgi:hypothetical protein